MRENDAEKQEIVERIESFSNTCSVRGWDGYFAEPVPESLIRRTVAEVDKYLKPFVDLGFPLRNVSAVPTPIGGVQFEGEHKNMYLELEVKPP